MTRFPCGTGSFVYPAPEGPTPNPRHHCHSPPSTLPYFGIAKKLSAEAQALHRLETCAPERLTAIRVGQESWGCLRPADTAAGSPWDLIELK